MLVGNDLKVPNNQLLESFGSEIEYEITTMKTKMSVVKSSWASSFDEKTFLKTPLGFSPFRDFNGAWHPKEHNSQNNTKKLLQSIKFILCVCIDGTVVNGVQQPKLFSYVLNEPPGETNFCEPEILR